MNVDELRLAIDRDAEVAIGVQLAWALRARIEGGSARAGERLPGLREVAEATGLNINTVRAVYQRLDGEGLIDSRQGSGTFVSADARGPASARAIAANAAREARETGVDPRAVAAALYVARDDAAGRAGEGGARRRELRAQIGALERAIGELESEHPGVAPPAPRSGRANGPALLGARELEGVRAVLVRRLASVQNAIDAHLIEAAEAAATAPAAPRARAASRVPTRPTPTAARQAPAKRGAKQASRKAATPAPPRLRSRPVRPATAEG
jgi:DNA-binding transcriptional regulator YhcF (GntR family)